MSALAAAVASDAAGGLELTAWRGRDDNLTMSRSFNRFSMKKPMATFERHAYSSTGSLLDHKHIYSHLSPKRLR